MSAQNEVFDKLKQEKKTASDIENKIQRECLTSNEFLDSIFFKNCSPHSKTLIKDLFDKLELMNIEFYVDKRKKNDFILVAASRINAKINKNILTVWTHQSSIDIRIMPNPIEHYYREEDLGTEFMEKAKSKYLEISGLYPIRL